MREVLVLWYYTTVAVGTITDRTSISATIVRGYGILVLPCVCSVERRCESMTLSDLITQLISIGTTFVPAATVGLIVTAAAVVSGAAMLLRRLLRAGR